MEQKQPHLQLLQEAPAQPLPILHPELVCHLESNG
jgi:hypothetical protein